MIDIELFVFDSNTLSHLAVCKQMSPDSFKNVAYKLFIY